MRVTDEEAARIEEAARHSGFGTEHKAGAASYAKAVVLGHNPPSVFDQQVMVEVCRIHGDLGRVGGLLKLAVTQNQDIAELRAGVREMTEVRAELKRLIGEIRDGKWTR